MPFMFCFVGISKSIISFDCLVGVIEGSRLRPIEEYAQAVAESKRKRQIRRDEEEAYRELEQAWDGEPPPLGAPAHVLDAVEEAFLIRATFAGTNKLRFEKSFHKRIFKIEIGFYWDVIEGRTLEESLVATGRGCGELR